MTVEVINDESDIIEVIQEVTSVVEVIERGPQGPNGISIPTEIVSEFPVTPVEGTLYIKI